MGNYIKFWLAKELSGLLIFLGILALIALFISGVYIYTQGRYYWLKWRGGSHGR